MNEEQEEEALRNVSKIADTLQEIAMHLSNIADLLLERRNAERG
jgi:hypothetical protein